MKYKVGDKVRVREDLEPHKVYSMIGSEGKNAFVSGMMKYLGRVLTIRSLAGGQYTTFEDPLYSWTDEMFEGTHAEPKIVITSDGQTVTAKKYDGKKVVNTATVKCSPRDTYDFDIGARLAVERLLGEADPEPKPTPKFEAGVIARVKCKSERISHCFKPGTVVEVIDLGPLAEHAERRNAIHCRHKGLTQYVPAEDLEKIEF